jgi:hypothetical protein
MFHGQKPQSTMRLLKVQSQETKVVLCQFISKDSVLKQVSLTIQMADIKNSGSSAKGKKVSKINRHHNYDFYFKIKVIKRAK